MHEVCRDEAREGKQTWNGMLQSMRHAQQQEGNQRDGDLNPHGVLGGTENVAEFEGMFDLTEEQLDLPAPLV